MTTTGSNKGAAQQNGDGAPRNSDDSGVDQARRKLLKLGVYVAPLVLGTLATPKLAHAQLPSCGPATCNPNNPPVCTPNSCAPKLP